jgi:EAL domain-containing protein (putative c-di-GMP-specific phosphodiesterase class I)
VAEESGLIGALGVQVARQAAAQLARWREELGDGAPRVAINLSASQLAIPIDPILEATGDQLDHLAIEISETALMADVERVSDHLQELKARGATIIVDNFGAGRSSLSHLKRLPIDALKIDRAFVGGLSTDADDRAIVYAIVQLAHALGIAVVAEGVEAREQLEILEEFSCDYAQGYLIAPPRPASEALSLNRRR